MANPTGTNQYGIYDLDRVRQALEGLDWETALRPFQYVRMATTTQIQEYTGLPRRRVFKLLKALAGYAEEVPTGAKPAEAAAIQMRRILIPSREKVVHRAEADTREMVFLLGLLGAGLLQDLGLMNDLRGSEERRVSSQAHSLCILDLMLRAEADGIIGLRPEKLLPNARRQTLRADVAVPERSGDTLTGWHAIDVEQTASVRNSSRLELQAERWQAFFAGPQTAEPVSPRLLLLFNVRPADVDETLIEWRNALAAVLARQGHLNFTVRYAHLADFLETPIWDPADWARLNDVQPRPHPATLPDEPTRDPLEVEAPAADLYGLCERALVIYALSRGEPEPLARCRRPVASLRALRDWLASPEMEGSRQMLRQVLGKMNGAWPPAQILFVLNKALWDALLRPFGVDRNHLGPLGAFQAAVVGPAISDLNAAIYGDYHVRVRLSANLADEIRAAGLVNQYQGENILSNALEWMLAAPFTYAYELGLRDQPWLAGESLSRKKGGKTN